MSNVESKGMVTVSAETEKSKNLKQEKDSESVARPSEDSSGNKVKNAASRNTKELSSKRLTDASFSVSSKHSRKHSRDYKDTSALSSYINGEEDDSDREMNNAHQKKHSEGSRRNRNNQHEEEIQGESSRRNSKKYKTLSANISSRKRDYFDPSKTQESTPFYYKVSSDPAQVNVLPPGTYLVIPQNKISELPLKVYRHPEAQKRNISREHNPSGRGRYPFKAADEDPQKAKKKGDGNEEVSDEVNTEADAEDAGYTDSDVEENEIHCIQRFDYVSALTFAPHDRYRPPRSIEIDGNGKMVQTVRFDVASLLKNRLPYCDIDEIRRDWMNNKYASWKIYITEKRESKVLEVCKHIAPGIPSSELEGLKRQIRAVMTNHTSMDGVIAHIKRKLALEDL